jgi:hypothetical protein
MSHSLNKVCVYQRDQLPTRNIPARNHLEKKTKGLSLRPSEWINSQEQTILRTSGFLSEEVGRSAKLTKTISAEF